MPTELNKEARLDAIDAAIRAADAVLETIAELTESFDPVVVASAERHHIRARNQIDDLRIIRAFVQRSGDLTPVSEETAEKLDALGRQLEESTRASALANAGLAFLARAVETATQVGQILDERPRLTSSPPGTSAQSA